MAGKKKKRDKRSVTKVFIDSKEKDFINKSKIFFDNKHIKNEQKALDDGDLKILLSTKKFFLVERKRYDDFASSYIKKHLQDQAIRMNETGDFYCVIVHGSMEDIYRARQYNPQLKYINEKTIEKMHQKMELVYKCPCFFVDNDIQYFNKVLELCDMLVKAEGNSHIVKTSITVQEHPELSILMAKEGIGEGVAKMLIDEFGSPKDVLYASREDLLSVNGVGDSTVVKVKELKEIFENGAKEKETI